MAAKRNIENFLHRPVKSKHSPYYAVLKYHPINNYQNAARSHGPLSIRHMLPNTRQDSRPHFGYVPNGEFS
jgi:hypothetical protein